MKSVFCLTVWYGINTACKIDFSCSCQVNVYPCHMYKMLPVYIYINLQCRHIFRTLETHFGSSTIILPLPMYNLYVKSWTHPFTQSQPTIQHQMYPVFSLARCSHLKCVCHSVERGLLCPPKPHYWPIERNLGVRRANILLTLVTFHCDLKDFSIFLCLCTWNCFYCWVQKYSNAIIHNEMQLM